VIEGIYDPRTRETATTHETGPLRRGESWTTLEVIPAVYVVEGSTQLERAAPPVPLHLPRRRQGLMDGRGRRRPPRQLLDLDNSRAARTSAQDPNGRPE
jgi:hypothetical protein